MEEDSVIQPATLDIDTSKCVVKCVISTGNEDFAKDVIDIDGIDLSKHELNPVVLFNHQRWLNGVAKAKDPDGKYTVRKAGKQLLGDSWFPQSLAASMEIFSLIEAGVINGISIGGIPIEKYARVDKQGYPTGGAEIVRMVMNEFSHCVLPENGEAVVLAVEKGLRGKALTPYIRSTFDPIYKSFKDKQPTIVSVIKMADETDDKKKDDKKDAPEPAGKAFVKAYHGMLKACHKMLNDTIPVLEHPDIKSYGTEEIDMMGQRVDKASEVYKSAYEDDMPEDDDKDVEKHFKSFADKSLTLENERLKKALVGSDKNFKELQSLYKLKCAGVAK